MISRVVVSDEGPCILERAWTWDMRNESKANTELNANHAERFQANAYLQPAAYASYPNIIML